MEMDRLTKRRTLGNTGMRVGIIGLGAAEIGFEGSSRRVVDTLISGAIDAGINVIDTAAMYADSEEKIGFALQGKRDKVFLFTKCGRCAPRKLSPHYVYAYLQRRLRRLLNPSSGGDCGTLDWEPSILRWNIDQSLRRLKSDHIDLIQLHSCSGEILQCDSVLEVLDRARDAGKVRYIGYSSDGQVLPQVIQSNRFDTIQLSINIADQEPLTSVIPMANEQGLGVIAKRAVANGLWRNSTLPAFIHHQTYWKRFQLLRYEFLQGDRAFEVALQFTLSVPGVHLALVGTTNLTHLLQNIRSAAHSISKEEYDFIRLRWNALATQNWDNQI